MTKSCLLPLVLVVALLCNGCYTTEHVMMKADGHRETDNQGNSVVVGANPAYDLLIPVTIPCDIIISPGVAIYWLYTMHSMGNWGDGSQ